MKWIKTSDRLPEHEQKVLVYSIFQGSEAMTFYKDGEHSSYVHKGDYFQDYDYGGHKIESITHWMELPNNPE